MFTNRFLSIPIIIVDAKQLDQGLSEPNEKEVKAKINPVRIESYRESFLGDDWEQDACKIYMQSGDSYTTTLTINEFEKLLNDFEK